MADINVKDIERAQQKAAACAVELDRALGLTYYMVKNGKLYAVTPDGKKRLIRKALFGSRQVKNMRIRLKNER